MSLIVKNKYGQIYAYVKQLCQKKLKNLSNGDIGYVEKGL